MAAPASIKDELHARIDAMEQSEAEQLLDFLNLQSDPDELTPAEEEAVLAALKRVEAGEFVTQEEFERTLGFKA
jgi:hypothetical protein